MSKYVFENNYSILIFDDIFQAIESYEYHFSRLTEVEKSKLEYFRLYEIQHDHFDIYDGDLVDIMVGDYIRFYK